MITLLQKTVSLYKVNTMRFWIHPAWNLLSRMNADARVFWKCVFQQYLLRCPLCSSLILTGLGNLRASLISVFFFNGFPFLFLRFQFPLLYLWIHWLCFLPTQTCYWIPIVGQIFPLGIFYLEGLFLKKKMIIYLFILSQCLRLVQMA